MREMPNRSIERTPNRLRRWVAALELVEAITLISDEQLPDSVYEQAAASLSREEVAAIEWLAVVINAWNRIAISSRYPVKA